MGRTLHREMTISQTDSDNRTVELSFASEEPYQRWFGPEVLQVDELAMDLSRFQNGLGCLLYNHDRDCVIGHIESVWIDGGRAYATVKFDEDEESERIYQKVLSGTLQGVSVGYAVNEYTDVKIDESLYDGRIKGPCYVATAWEPLEISIVSVPADATVGVNRSMEEFNEIFNVVRLQQEESMNFEEMQERAVEVAAEPTQQTPQVVDETATARAVEAERSRVAQISELCRHFEVDPSEFIRGGQSLADVQTAVLARAREAQAPRANIEMGMQEETKYRNALEDAILLRGGVQVVNPAEGANEFRGMRMRSIVEDVLAREGVSNVNRLDEEGLLRAALTSTSALPGILSNVANKSLARGYESAPTTFELFTTVGSNVDFKEATRYRLSEAGGLLEIKENGEFKSDEITEDSAKTKVLTYGRSFSFTRQMLVNDDLSALTRIPSLYAAQCKRGINRLVYQTLADAPFSTEAGNMAANGGELSLATIDAGRLAMRLQKNIRGEEVLNIAPRYLVVPTAKEFLARQLMTSTSDPNATHYGVTNPLQGSLQIISDAELDLIDSNAWYLLADQGIMDTIEVTYLNGVQTPTIESQVAFDTLGIRYRIYMDYGVSVLDPKGLYKNAGK